MLQGVHEDGAIPTPNSIPPRDRGFATEDRSSNREQGCVSKARPRFGCRRPYPALNIGVYLGVACAASHPMLESGSQSVLVRYGLMSSSTVPSMQSR